MKISEYKKHAKVVSKYGNKKTLYGDRLYDSKKEAHRAIILDVLQKKGIIKSWEPQFVIKAIINDTAVFRYIADFRVTYPDGRIEIEDVKPEFTKKLPLYRLKKKCLKALYNIDIVEI